MKNLILESEMKFKAQISIVEPGFDPDPCDFKGHTLLQKELNVASHYGPSTFLRSQIMVIEDFVSLKILDSDPLLISTAF